MTVESGAKRVPEQQRLQSNTLSVPNCVALSAAVMAPVIGAVLNAPAASPNAGEALPLAFLVAFIVSLFVGNTVIQFSRRLPSSGSFYTYTSRGLGPLGGFFAGWLFFAAYACLGIGLFTATGSFAADYVTRTFHSNVPYWVFSFAFVALVTLLAVLSIRTSVRVDLALLSVEVTVFTLLAIIAIVEAGSGNSASAFLPSGSPKGVSGVGLGVVFGILSFVGFDAAATLGEETKNPKRNVPLGVGAALLIVGAFYVLVMYGLVAGYHANSPKGLTAFTQDVNPFITLAHRDAPWMEQIIDLAAIAGIFSAFLALQNTTARVIFSMAREGVLPTVLGGVHTRFHSPYMAIYALNIFAIIVGLIMGAWIGPGATGTYGFTGSIGTVAIVLVYILSNAALVRFFWNDSTRNVIMHVVAPILGTLGLLFPLWSVAQPGQSYPYNYVPFIVIVWIVLGAGLYLYFRSSAPGKLAALGSVLAEQEDNLVTDIETTGEPLIKHAPRL